MKKKILTVLAVAVGIIVLATVIYLIYLFVDVVIPMIPGFLYSLLRIV